MGYEYVSGVYLCQLDQNMVFGAEDIVQTRFFLSIFSRFFHSYMTGDLEKLSQWHQGPSNDVYVLIWSLVQNTECRQGFFIDL